MVSFILFLLYAFLCALSISFATQSDGTSQVLWIIGAVLWAFNGVILVMREF